MKPFCEAARESVIRVALQASAPDARRRLQYLASRGIILPAEVETLMERFHVVQ